MSLVLEIEYLSGACFAAIGPDSDMPDWPPQPDRVFSALVASWGARGERKDEAKALEWLERQSAPKIDASEHSPRSVPTSYVPPNDPESGRSGNKEVLPAYRRRQPRRFPATRPHEPIVRLIWNEVLPDEGTLKCLGSIAADTSYVGHSASLTRCHFHLEEGEKPRYRILLAKRRVYPGRMEELQRNFAEFYQSGGRRGRPLVGAYVAPAVEPSQQATRAFEDRWLLLEHTGGEMPDIRAAALVVKSIRDALLSGYRKTGLEDRIPEMVSGHSANGEPSRLPHLAVVPLSFAGFPYADGHVMGFALVPPRGSEILDDQDFRKALRKIAPLDEVLSRRVMTVRPKAGGAQEDSFSICLSPMFEPPINRRSLSPELYCGASRVFATVTPMVLDRFLKKKGDAREEEVAQQIAVACRNIGLPEPDLVVADKHSVYEGAPSAYPSGKAPAWMRWRLPAAIRGRQLVHAVVRFPEPVRGPVLLGAGRFLGLGLCRPLQDEGECA